MIDAWVGADWLALVAGGFVTRVEVRREVEAEAEAVMKAAKPAAVGSVAFVL
jgi:hypothetical protein